MDKAQRFEYIRTVENYLEKNPNPSSDSNYFTHVYEIFIYLYKQLLINRPEDPLEFLIQRLGKPQPVRIFVVGTPGALSKDICDRLAAHFSFQQISMGKVLCDEAERSNATADKIKGLVKDYRMVDDDTAI